MTMSEQINYVAPAFPTPAGSLQNDGMSMRDVFAAAAMNGICSSRNHSDLKGHALASARVAYALADAMLKAREEGK